jgi:hypothetical protein
MVDEIRELAVPADAYAGKLAGRERDGRVLDEAVLQAAEWALCTQDAGRFAA